MASISKLKDRKAKPWQVRIRRKGKSIVQYFRTKRDSSSYGQDWCMTLGPEC